MRNLGNLIWELFSEERLIVERIGLVICSEIGYILEGFGFFVCLFLLFQWSRVGTKLNFPRLFGLVLYFH